MSVVVPTYNRAHVLRRALESVLAQTFQDFEVLVVDDGSTDETAALMTEYEARDERVHCLAQPQNTGVSAARNRGLRDARGEFIAFLDSDDEWMPEKLARQIALFRKVSERVGLLYTGVESLFEGGSTKVHLPSHRGHVYDDLLLENVIHGGGSNVMIRRSVVRGIGYFDEEIPAIEDWDYWLRIARYYEVGYVARPLIRYYNIANTVRRSLHSQANMDARARFYAKHSAAMRRAGVAHLFLLKSAQRCLAPPERDVRRALQQAIRAALARPLFYEVYPVLFRALLPPRGYRWFQTGRQAIRHLAGA